MMNTFSALKTTFRGAWAAAALLIGPGLLVASGSLSAQYLGAESCADSSCHRSEYRQWLASGHRAILMEEEAAESRPVPTPEGQIWDDFSYLIGGHKTKALFLDRDGYIYTPSAGNNQFNLLTGEFSDYHAGEADKVYDCGSCHTTGFEAGGSPDGLPGIAGTFALPGVQCEHCHGPGLAMQAGDPAICEDCHNHGPEAAVKASGGFIVSEGQHNELMAGPHAALSDGCVSCHDPHQPAEFGIVTACSNCHASEASAYAGTLMDKVGVVCEDCHMPPATLSAQPLGPKTGDMKTHIFYINTDPGANMFTNSGANVALTGGKGAVTLDFACQRCHQGASVQDLARFARDFHDPNKDLSDFGLDPGLSGTWWGGPPRDGEGFVLEFAYAGDALFLFASLYTYDTEGNQVWLVAAATVPSDANAATVDMLMPVDGKWGDALVPSEVDRINWGAGTFTFTTCSAGTINLAPNSEMQALGFTELSYDISRILTSGIKCPTFANNTR